MITLISDFGLKDPYVAEMKGVILTINPKAIIIDIAHEVEKFNIRMGAFILASAAHYFPQGTVHLAVVDPEVGTQRRAILIQTKESFFVGPDNGILVLAAHSQGIKHVYQLVNPTFMLTKISNTFHGRDIFAPVAAYLDIGASPEDFGPELTGCVKPEFSNIEHLGDSIIGEVLYIDDFGNIITNITQLELKKMGHQTTIIQFPETSLKVPFGKTYAQTQKKEPILLIGSHGFLEIALNQANAAEKFQVKAGDSVKVTIS
jgi:hypothetical protein